MKLIYGFLIVVIVLLVNSLSMVFFRQLLLPESVAAQVLIATTLVVFASTLVGGIIFWVLRATVAHLLSSRVFKSSANYRELLGDYGIAHFPFAIGPVAMFLILFGNIGLFLALFISVTSMLFAYLFFCQAVIAVSGLTWKKSVAVIVIAELIAGALIVFIPSVFGTQLNLNMLLALMGSFTT